MVFSTKRRNFHSNLVILFHFPFVFIKNITGKPRFELFPFVVPILSAVLFKELFHFPVISVNLYGFRPVFEIIDKFKIIFSAKIRGKITRKKTEARPPE